MAEIYQIGESGDKEFPAIQRLSKILPNDYLITTKVRLEKGPELDSVLICPHAIFCLEFKNWWGVVKPSRYDPWKLDEASVDNAFTQANTNKNALVSYLRNKKRNKARRVRCHVGCLIVLTHSKAKLDLTDPGLGEEDKERVTLLENVPTFIEQLKEKYQSSPILGEKGRKVIARLLKNPNDKVNQIPTIEKVETATEEESKTADEKRDQPQEGTQVKSELPVTIWKTPPEAARRWTLRIAGLTAAAVIVFLLVSAISNHLNNQAIQRELLSLGSRINATATMEELETLKQEVNKKIADETYKNYIDTLTQLGRKIEELKSKIESPRTEKTIPPTPSAPGKETSPPIVVQPPIPNIPSDPECAGLEGIQWVKKEIKLWVLYSDKFGVKWKTTKGSSLCVRWDVTVERERELGFRPPPVWKVCWQREYFKDTWCRMPQSPYNLFYLVGLENGVPVGDSPDQARIMAGEGIISRSLIWYYDHATGRWGRQVRDN